MPYPGHISGVALSLCRDGVFYNPRLLSSFDKDRKDLESLILTIRIYNQNIGKEFGIFVLDMLIRKKIQIERTEGTKQLNQEIMITFREKEN